MAIARWAKGQGTGLLGYWQKLGMGQLPAFGQEKMSLGPFRHKRGTQTLVGILRVPLGAWLFPYWRQRNDKEGCSVGGQGAVWVHV